MKAIFVTGTDTEVGKTIICGCLASFLCKRGYKVITQKWVHTGVGEPVQDIWGSLGSCELPQDIVVHLRMAGISREEVEELLPHMVPYSFPLPASPHLAAESAGKKTEPDVIEASFKYLSEKFDLIVVEGVGGLMVPLRRDLLLVDLVERFRLPTIVVARNSLGAINHTLLTIEALRRRKIEVLGVIFNNLVDGQREAILEDNPRIVNELSGVKVLGVMPKVNFEGEMAGAFEPIGERILAKIRAFQKGLATQRGPVPSSRKMTLTPFLAKDREYIWHPYTQMKDHEEAPPILIERAEGIKLYDDRGGLYYDTISSWWCNVHGHNHPKIKQAIKRQMDSLEHVLFAGFTHRPAITLAEKLCSIAPQKLAKVFYSDDGSTSVEVALKMSLQYWQNVGRPERNRFISLENGYHGDTIGAMSVSGIPIYREKFSSLLFSSHKVPSPYCYRCPMGTNRDNCEIDCIKPLERVLREKGREISALILEPMVQAAGGMIIYPKEYLKRVAELAAKFGVHLILDEVATAFGRTGEMFACEHADIEPDFMCLSKGITSGYLPLGATLTTDEIYRAFYDDYAKQKTFYHGHTFTANPLSTQAAIASLEIFEKEDVLGRIKELIPLFHKGLESFGDLALVGDVRYIGLIGAIELVKNKSTKLPFKFEERVGWKIYREGLKNGLILRPLGDIIYLYLPLCIKKAELEEVLSRTYKVVAKIAP